MELLEDWAGWLLLFGSFGVVALFREMRRDGRLVLATWFVLAPHHIIAIINTYLCTVKGGEADAITQHLSAIKLAETGTLDPTGFGASLYVQVLGLFYRIFGSSHLFGEELSILAFLFSCVVFIKTINMLGLYRYRVGLVLLFGSLPSMLLFGSVTLREPLQILFFLLASYYGFRFRIDGRSKDLIKCIFSAIAMGAFHIALLIFIPFLLALFLLWKIEKKKAAHKDLVISKKNTTSIVMIAILILGLSMVATDVMAVIFDAWKSLISGKAVETIVQFRERAFSIEARASYGIMLDTSSLTAMAFSVIHFFWYYLFAPFPWQISNALDAYGAFESLLRFSLILFSIKAWHGASGVQRRCFGLFLVLYFSMAFLFSLGTVNYGTAIRHHLVNYWIIVLLGGPGLLSFLKRMLNLLVVKPKCEPSYHRPLY